MPVAEPLLGWQFVDRGPAPRSNLLDAPPATDDRSQRTAHQDWRARVEADERRLTATHQRLPVWFPVTLASRTTVLPVFGGSPATWGALIATVTTSAAKLRYRRIRIVNLTQHSIFGALHDLARSTGTLQIRGDTVSGTGSSVDMFRNLPAEQLAGLVVDVYRTAPGRRGTVDAARAMQELLEILAMLSGAMTLHRLRDALGAALGHTADGITTLSKPEQHALSDYHADVVNARQQITARLADLHRDVGTLVRFGRSTGRPPERIGHGAAGAAGVRTFEADAGSGTHDRELARELLARAVARGFEESTAGPELLVVAGAETLAPEVREALTGTAQRRDKQLILLSSRIDDQTGQLLGHAGSGAAIFLCLPNHADAKSAAEHLGREFTFVVNGISIADGRTSSWQRAHSQSTSSTKSRTRSTTSQMALFSRSFGKSVSNSFTQSAGTTTGTGGSTQQTRTTSAGRVHEYVVQPEVFQRLDENVMLLVDRHTVRLANCDHRIAGLPVTSAKSLTSTTP